MGECDSDQSPTKVKSGDRLLVVANPATRRDIRKTVASLRRAAPPDVVIDVRITTRAGEAEHLARQHAEGARMVIAVGGDGTVAEVATAVVGKDIPLAILPGGSTNIIAREMHVPVNTEVGVALLLGKHRVQRVDVGTSDRRVFLHMAGAGFDSRMFARSNSKLKRRIGWLAYWPAAARTLLERPAHVRVRVDGTEVRAQSPLVLIANGRSVMHPSMTIASGISNSDGLFDVFIVTATTPLAISRVLGRFATRHLENSPHVTRLRGRHIELEADPPLPVQFDGDVSGMTPATFEIMDKALQIVVPVRSSARRR